MSTEQPDLDGDLFSFPRRFDLASLLAISTGYSLLFAAVHLLDGGVYVGFAIGGFLATVAIAQAVLMGGKKPREASVIAGGVYSLTVIVVGAAFAGEFGMELMCAIVGGLFWGPPAGYLAGTLVGGVFLVADALRRMFRVIQSWRRGAETDANDVMQE
ncbi:hypothetical protein [Stieleria varia]|uniref:Uncharacterized protein n=1 Tax=Stieleria varia TaxID=2528005 RepID=A0A5C6AXW9_9BACT|nr:hypothetical protein [Stieleria varia]TWU04478.1 hypothetical protein Pla52n_25190 [Stieleria varia]